VCERPVLHFAGDEREYGGETGADYLDGTFEDEEVADSREVVC
jgi:hypothetical protein